MSSETGRWPVPNPIDTLLRNTRMMGCTAIDASKFSQETTKIRIDVHADPKVSYAPYQNNVPLVRSLTLSNATESSIVSSNPDYLGVQSGRSSRQTGAGRAIKA